MVTREQDSDDSDDDDDDDAVDDLLDSDEDEIDEDGQVYLESLQVGSPLADLQGYLAGLQEKLFLHKKLFFLKYIEILGRFTRFARYTGIMDYDGRINLSLTQNSTGSNVKIIGTFTG